MTDLVILRDQREIILVNKIQPTMGMILHLVVHIRQQLDHGKIRNRLTCDLGDVQGFVHLVLV